MSKVLRHEEFSEGCKATCNGPYNGKWSKTMVGYGSEDSHFVAELTYNYGIDKYKLGNDFGGLTVCSREATSRAKASSKATSAGEAGGAVQVAAPDGYPFQIVDRDCGEGRDPVQSVLIGVKSLEGSLSFWKDLLGMQVRDQSAKEAALSFGSGQAALRLRELGEEVRHETAFGRIAFAVPADQLQGIQDGVKEGKLGKVATELVKLDTPGKATVQVVILEDPDGYEICFVGEEGFKELSQTDPEADKLLAKAMEEDKSKEWYAKKGLKKDAA